MTYILQYYSMPLNNQLFKLHYNKEIIIVMHTRKT